MELEKTFFIEINDVNNVKHKIELFLPEAEDLARRAQELIREDYLDMEKVKHVSKHHELALRELVDKVYRLGLKDGLSKALAEVKEISKS